MKYQQEQQPIVVINIHFCLPSLLVVRHTYKMQIKQIYLQEHYVTGTKQQQKS